MILLYVKPVLTDVPSPPKLDPRFLVSLSFHLEFVLSEPRTVPTNIFSHIPQTFSDTLPTNSNPTQHQKSLLRPHDPSQNPIQTTSTFLPDHSNHLSAKPPPAPPPLPKPTSEQPPPSPPPLLKPTYARAATVTSRVPKTLPVRRRPRHACQKHYPKDLRRPRHHCQDTKSSANTFTHPTSAILAQLTESAPHIRCFIPCFPHDRHFWNCYLLTFPSYPLALSKKKPSKETADRMHITSPANIPFPVVLDVDDIETETTTRRFVDDGRKVTFTYSNINTSFGVNSVPNLINSATPRTPYVTFTLKT